MFQDHFRLTVAENKGITAISLFIILLYGHYWNAAPLAERAPLNDTRLLAQIKTYHNYVIIRSHSAEWQRRSRIISGQGC